MDVWFNTMPLVPPGSETGLYYIILAGVSRIFWLFCKQVLVATNWHVSGSCPGRQRGKMYGTSFVRCLSHAKSIMSRCLRALVMAGYALSAKKMPSEHMVSGLTFKCCDSAYFVADYLNGHYMMGVHLISHFKNRYDPVMLRGRISEGPDDHATQRHYRPSVREPPVPPVGYVQHRIESHSMVSYTTLCSQQFRIRLIPRAKTLQVQWLKSQLV